MKNQTYQRVWSYADSPPKLSNFFPSDWPPEKVALSIRHVLENPSIKESFGDNVKITGYTSDKIKLIIHIKMVKKEHGKVAEVVSAYPAIY